MESVKDGLMNNCRRLATENQHQEKSLFNNYSSTPTDLHGPKIKLYTKLAENNKPNEFTKIDNNDYVTRHRD